MASYKVKVGSPVEKQIAGIVLDHLDEMEDLRIAEQRWRDVESGKSGTVPLEDVMKRYGMEV